MFEKVQLWVGHLLLLLVMLIVDLPVLIFVSRQPSQDKSICVLRLDNIGDFILWLDAARGLREFYHDRVLVLLVDNALAEFAADTSLWDEIWPIDRRKMKLNPFYRYKILRRARKRGFDTVIHPTFSRHLMFGDALVLATGAIKRIGSTGDLSNIYAWHKKISDQWYTQLIPAKQEPLMELVRNAEFLRGIGHTSFRAKCPQLSRLQQKTKQFLPTTPYYVLFPGASLALKKWPSSSFAQIADWLFEYSKFEGVICGASAEQVDAKKIQGSSKSVLRDLTGSTSLSELSDVISGAALLISNDTSAVHMATAVGVPAVCILGGGHYGRFLPYQTELPCSTQLPITVVHSMDCFGCNWQCQYNLENDEPAPCVARVTVESVVKVVRPVIDAIVDNRDTNL